jgi:hypothetical protein
LIFFGCLLTSAVLLLLFYPPAFTPFIIIAVGFPIGTGSLLKN